MRPKVVGWAKKRSHKNRSVRQQAGPAFPVGKTVLQLNPSSTVQAVKPTRRIHVPGGEVAVPPAAQHVQNAAAEAAGRSET